MKVCNPSLNASASIIAIELSYGRLRRVYIVGVLLAGVVAGWLWFGNAGAGLFGLWMWSGHWQDWHGGSRSLTIVLDDLRYVRLSAHRVLCVSGILQACEIFSDELEAAEYARLRRELKAWFSPRRGGLKVPRRAKKVPRRAKSAGA